MSKWLKRFVEKESQNRTDKTDRFNPKMNMSVLSVPPPGLLDINLGNIPQNGTDRTDKPQVERLLSVPVYDPYDLLHNFEERVAIVEYDGCQSPLQAQCIAYQDAFIAVLVTLPHEQPSENLVEDWFDQRVNAAKGWLTLQGLYQPQ